MKNLTMPVGHLVMLAELDDKDAGLMAKAIAHYANESTVPTFANGALKAIFSLFRSAIDAQIESATKRSEINSNNAQGKKSTKKKSSKKTNDAVTIEETRNELEQVATDVPKMITLADFEAVYPKIGSFRDESLNILSTFSEDKKRRALDYVSLYVEEHSNVSELLYLSQYLKSEPWNK